MNAGLSACDGIKLSAHCSKQFRMTYSAADRTGEIKAASDHETRVLKPFNGALSAWSIYLHTHTHRNTFTHTHTDTQRTHAHFFAIVWQFKKCIFLFYFFF